MKEWQCSICFKNYSFDEFIRLVAIPVLKGKNGKNWGKHSVCECGAIFHEDTWRIISKVEDYYLSNVHLELGHPTGMDIFDDSMYYYETMIFHKKGNHFGDPLSFQVRYKTREEAIQGHKLTYQNIHKILLDPSKYPMDLFSQFGNFLEREKEEAEVKVKKEFQ